MSDNLPIVYPASELTVKFPEKNQHISDTVANSTRSLVRDCGAYTGDGRAYIGMKALPHVLATDQKGAKRFYNDLDEDDKLENTQGLFASVSSVGKELSERIQEPRDTITREQLRDSEACLNAMRDAPELEKMREVEESKNRREQPKLKEKKIRAENITACQLSGEPLEPDAAAHHKERRADKPRKARELSNIVVVNPQPHKIIHSVGAESPEELRELCNEKGWSYPG